VTPVPAPYVFGRRKQASSAWSPATTSSAMPATTLRGSLPGVKNA
jgi:hypothetical protein